jgi:hypothetical protein
MSTAAGHSVVNLQSDITNVIGVTVGSTDILGGGISVPYQREGVFDTPPGEGLILSITGSVRIVGYLEYAIIPGVSIANKVA